MNFSDLTEKKKQGKAHSEDEINFIVSSYMSGEASDAQAAAWTAAVYFKGMTLDETVSLTEALGKSGKIINFGELGDKIADKHSTGGVGDKVTITLIPLLAAAGLPVAKLADRTLGASAGTVDKLEAIPNLNTNLSSGMIVNQVKNINAVIASQADDLAPADKKMYALRNEIGILNSAPLVASSIIAKKIASGASNIIIDVKYGSGACMRTLEDARELANLLVKVAKRLDKSLTAIITSMEEPLGRAVGHAIEVIEAIEFLKGHCDNGDLAELTYAIGAATLLHMDLYNNDAEAVSYLKNLVHSGRALEKFKELIIAQGGAPDVIENYDKFTLPAFKIQCEAKKSGFVQNISADNISCAAKALGALRDGMSKPVDLSVGIYLNKKSGEYVSKGEVLFTIYANTEESAKIAQMYCDNAFSVSESKPSRNSLIYKIISTKDEDENV